MANAFLLKAESRNDIGKGASRRLRREEKIPAVIYGGEEEPKSITICHSAILKCLNDSSFFSQLVDIDVDGEVEEVIVRDLQRHPYKPTVLHADFQRVVRGQELTINVPVVYVNVEESKGVKAGGILSQNVIDVEVICRPSLIPESLEVDVAELDINDVLRLTDIKLPEGVRLVALEGEDTEENDEVIVSIQPPQAEVVEEASTEEVATEEAPAEEAGE